MDWMRLLNPSAGPLLMGAENEVRIRSRRFFNMRATFLIGGSRSCGRVHRGPRWHRCPAASIDVPIYKRPPHPSVASRTGVGSQRGGNTTGNRTHLHGNQGRICPPPERNRRSGRIATLQSILYATNRGWTTYCPTPLGFWQFFGDSQCRKHSQYTVSGTRPALVVFRVQALAPMLLGR